MLDEPLKFNADGKFRILVFTDIHAKPDRESKKAKLKNRDTFLFMNSALDALKPDLVILGGDNCTNFDCEKGLAEFYPVFEGVTRPMVERKIPFAAVLGNHEHDMPEEILDLVLNEYARRPFCLAKNQYEGGNGKLDYRLIIKDSRGEKDAFVLWLMDANNLIGVEGRDVYDGVREDQIEWYERTAAEIKKNNGGKTLPAVVFQHIPVPEIYGLLRAPKFYELPVSEKGHDFLNCYRFVKNKTCEGYLGEGPDRSFYNRGQFASWKKTGDVVGAFFGHDHMNDFHGTFDGVVMGQCKTGGFWAYTDGCRTGTRVIDLNENNPRKIETKMVRFKELGLKSESLGPIQKRITDRQSLALHKLKWVALGAAAAVCCAEAVKKRLK